MSSRMKAAYIVAGSLCAVLLLSIIALYIPHSSVQDDAFMFVRYARHFQETGVLRWNADGPATYGPTSLAFWGVVLLVQLFRLDPIVTLLVSSVLSTILFGVMSVRFYGVERQRGERVLLPIAAGSALALLGATSLGWHATSGMDTMLGLAYIALVLPSLSAWTHKPTARLSLCVSLLLIGTLLVRPDASVLFLPALLLPFAMRQHTTLRRASFRLLCMLLAGATLWFLFATLTLHSPIPLSAYAKVTHQYDSYMDALYSKVAAASLVELVRVWAGLLLSTAAAILFVLRTGGVRESWLEFALLGGVVAFVAMERFSVLQIMGEHHRFYLPIVPVLLYLNSRLLPRVFDALRTARSRALLRAGVLLLCVAAVVQGGTTVSALLRRSDHSYFTVADDYQKGWPSRYWYRLDRLGTIPDVLTIATTEVGRPAVMLPQHRIIDLAGLNDTGIARHGLDPARLLTIDRPDVIWLLMNDYPTLREIIMRSAAFASAYETLNVPRPMLIAVRWDSPSYERIRALYLGP